MKLLLNALTKFIFGVIAIAILLFLPAGTFLYPNAYLFMAVLFVPVIIMGVVLYIKAPALLEKRLSEKENESTQKWVVALSGLMFVAAFIIPALDFRFSLSNVPLWCVILSSVIFLIGYAIFAEVLRENAYLSRTVEVQNGQTVISTGLYGVVRHPMYLATLLMFIPMPLILGSFWGLIPLSAYPVIIVVRIINEEKVLTKGLSGYEEYKKKVKYRLIPFIF
ncbi:MAG: isoprenylcysteine carboxylmethyltransferase family protein [Clostridia bacterium]|nr:isoprenylcysteine carboxylmethyltransferase family protein [Clostridia bacterium]